MSAVSKVFQISDLLICILEFVDERTLLLSERVNTRFRSAIMKDSIQRRLFFRAEPRQQATIPVGIKVNPLLAVLGDPFAFRFHPPAPRTGDVQYIEISLHSSFLQAPARYGGRYAHDARYRPRFQRGSWQRMLLYQPPADMEVCMWYHDGEVGEEIPCSHSLYVTVPASSNNAAVFAMPEVVKELAYAALQDIICHVIADVQTGLISTGAVYGEFSTHDAWLDDLCNRVGVDNSEANQDVRWTDLKTRDRHLQELSRD